MIGASVPRTEDYRLLTGAGRFVDDIALPGTLYMALLRSDHAHARVVSVARRPAMTLPGVRGIFTLDDLAELRHALPPPVMNAMAILPYRQSALVDGIARYVGEPVAVVLADSPSRAADAIAATMIEYQPLPPILDIEAARRPGSPLVRPEWNSNVAGSIRAETGDVEAVLAASDLVIAERFVIGRMSGLPLEPRAVVASWDSLLETLTVWTSTQMPYGVREYITRAMNLPRASVRVIAPDVGGGFGPKAVVYGEDIIASVLARRFACPVKWTETRSESMMATVHGHDQVHWAKLGLARDGRFTALDDVFLIDNGAYLPRGARTANNVLAHLMGPYRFDAFRCVGEVIVTNKTPTIPFRGAGRVQATYVTERLIQLAAQKLGIDPVDLRRRNLITPSELPLDRGIPYRPGLPVVYDSGDYPALLEAAAQMIGYDEFRVAQREARTNGRLLGCAIAMYTEGTGVPPAEGAMVSINELGQVTLVIGAASQGQSHQTTMAQVCAERLGVPFEQVTVVAGDTTRFPASPVSSGTFASRTAAVAGPAIALAVDEVKERIRRVASRIFECAVDDLDIEDGAVHVKGVKDHRLSLAEVAVAARGAEFLGEHAEPGLSATRYYLPPAVTWAAGAHAAIVEVCAETGVVEVLKYAVAHDVGRPINPQVVDGQAHGGVAQGLGSALMEEIVYDESGQLLTGSLLDYCLPRAESFPGFAPRSIDIPSTVNLLGIKGAGEGGTIPGQAIIANAVANALGFDGPELNRMPLRSERILGMLKRAAGA